MECQECHNTVWRLVWARALIEEGHEVDMYQCKKCKRVVMTTRDYLNSGRYI